MIRSRFALNSAVNAVRLSQRCIPRRRLLSDVAHRPGPENPKMGRAFRRAGPHLAHIGWATLSLGLGLQVASYNRDKKKAEENYEKLKNAKFEPKDFVTALRKDVFETKWAEKMTDSVDFSKKNSTEQASTIRRNVLTLLDNYSMQMLKNQRDTETQS